MKKVITGIILGVASPQLRPCEIRNSMHGVRTTGTPEMTGNRFNFRYKRFAIIMIRIISIEASVDGRRFDAHYLQFINDDPINPASKIYLMSKLLILRAFLQFLFLQLSRSREIEKRWWLVFLLLNFLLALDIIVASNRTHKIEINARSETTQFFEIIVRYLRECLHVKTIELEKSRVMTGLELRNGLWGK